MVDDFNEKKLKLVRSDKGLNFLGIRQMAQYHLSGGVSSHYSDVGFLTTMDDEDIQEIPDYVVSDSLQKDIDTNVSMCAEYLKKSKYLPDSTKIVCRYGAVEKGEREGAIVQGWEDYEILGMSGAPVYTKEDLKQFTDTGEDRFSTALWLIVKDICDEGRILSTNWYQARILLEYFRDYPVLPDSAFLIGELFKEYCLKQTYEGDLREYFARLKTQEANRQKGADRTRQKAEELRLYCVALFADMFETMGPRLSLAPAEVQARELQVRAYLNCPDDFQRSGKPYSEEWFLRNIIEDRKLDIIELIEDRQRSKRL